MLEWIWSNYKSHTLLVGRKYYYKFVVWQFLINIKLQLPYKAVILLLIIYQKEIIYTYLCMYIYEQLHR